MPTRRACLLGAVAAAGTLSHAGRVVAQVQKIDNRPTVGVLWHAGSQEEEGKYFVALTEGFRSAGYVDGRNIILEHRYPNEQLERFESCAQELVQLKPDVLVGVTRPAAVALQRTGTSIPIVFLIVPDPVGARLVQSLARPGANITGYSNVSADLHAKRIQLFKEAIPGLRRVALLINPADKVGADQTLADMKSAGASLGMTFDVSATGSPADFESVFSKIERARIDGVITALDPLFFAGRKKLAELAVAHRLPSMHANGDAVEAGFLISYGTNHEAVFRRTPLYVDKLLKGARPQDLPVEQPTKFEVAINMKTARAIGVQFPQSVLIQAEKVFE